MATERQKKLREALALVIPHAPFDEFEAILDKASKLSKTQLPPSIATWLATVAYIRHQHTDYDYLLEDGYDQPSARHFTREAINQKLQKWGCAREVSDED